MSFEQPNPLELSPAEQIAELKKQLAEKDEIIAQQRRELETDPGTGVTDRRVYHEMMKNGERGGEVSHEGEPVQEKAILLLDLDNFGMVNKIYGQTKGDEVLRKVGEKLQETFRTNKGDLVMRTGGEEFVVILPKTDAQAFLNRSLRVEIELDGKETGITFSGGITKFGVDDIFPDAVARANKAMHKAKEDSYDEHGTYLGPGKNRIFLYTDEMKNTKIEDEGLEVPIPQPERKPPQSETLPLESGEAQK